MNRLMIMTVGKTHSGKTTFANELESILQEAIVIDQDNHAEFINKHYMKLRPQEGPNKLKFTVTNTIVEYAIEQSHFHIILSNSNLHNPARSNVLRYFYEKGFKCIIVYFDLPTEVLIERIEKTNRPKTIFRNASSYQEVLERQEMSKPEEPSEDVVNHLFVIKDPNEISDVIQQIKTISESSI
ncbi:ATP-binding protein [Paenibacillus puldeungensis]|uniref:ATP-binding protein n=1 Tax=Paenibacillus puldeungensis TaxID=696536 RepID=A0ABW3RZN3_9BACL